MDLKCGGPAKETVVPIGKCVDERYEKIHGTTASLEGPSKDAQCVPFD